MALPEIFRHCNGSIGPWSNGRPYRDNNPVVHEKSGGLNRSVQHHLI